jgi:hypothetical protein
VRKLVTIALLAVLVGCGERAASDLGGGADFTFVARSPNAALLSVHGTAEDDVWLVGADDGAGPLALHFDGHAWERRATGASGALWWVNALPDGPVFFGGSEALLLRFEDGAFEPLPSPASGDETVFGVWAAAPDDVYAVGSREGRAGFVWHFDGERFRDVPLGGALPVDENGETPGLFKAWGTSASDVWLVGARGVVLRGNASEGFEHVASLGEATLFTVHARDGAVAMVGGASSGVIYETLGDELVERTPERTPLLQGVCVANDGVVWTAGFGGSVYVRRGVAYEPVDTGLDFSAAESLHAIWVDPEGGVWAAGGDVLTPELDQGLALHRGAPVPYLELEPRP